MIRNRNDYKYYLERDRIALKRKKGKVLKDPIWKYQILLRKSEFFNNCGPRFFRVLASISKRRMYVLGRKCGGISIPINCFGPGLSIAHYGSIVVNQSAVVGKNCRIHEGVTIGASGKDGKAATIGDNCFIGTGAKVIGNILIGNGIAIGANAVVTRDFVEDNITIAGIPAKKISDNSSKDLLADGVFDE